MKKLTEETLRALVERQDAGAIVREFERVHDHANDLALRLGNLQDERDNLADDIHDLQQKCIELERQLGRDAG